MSWQPCVDISEAMGGGIAEGSPTKSCSSAVVLWMPHSYAASERTFPMGSNVGKVLSVIQTYSIVMAKRFLNYICCNPFIRSVGADIESCSSHPASFLHCYLLYKCFQFLGGNLVRFNT